MIHVLVPLSTHSSLASSYTARDRSELTSEPASQRYLMGAAWLGLVAYLAFFFVQTETMLGTFVR